MKNKSFNIKVALLLCFFSITVIANKEFSVSSGGFTENKGQVLGFDGALHPEVKYIFNSGATQIFLTDKGIAYQFTKVTYPKGYLELLAKHTPGSINELFQLQQQIQTEVFRMNMSLNGANTNASVTAEGKSFDYTNYYNANVFEVHNFNKVTYHNIYPGIDWVIYVNDNQLKYDFVVKPTADPSLIKMQFNYQENLSLNSDGSFTLKNKLGSISEQKPVSFQNENVIHTKFVIKNNTLSFAINQYNSNQTLIIDPALKWSTNYGSNGYEQGYGCSTDVSGNVYLCGHTNSTSNIGSGGYQNFYGFGPNDAFLVKFNVNGVRQWGTYYGGFSGDGGNSCATDALGNVYLTGFTNSLANIAFGGHQNSNGGNGDAFLVKFNSAGVRQWATYYGDFGGESGTSCKIDDVTGDVYWTGYTSSTVNISSGGYQNTFGGGGGDAFLVKFNSSGVRQWATYYGGPLNDYATWCTISASGDLYISGTTNSSVNIASGGHQNSFGGGTNDAFLAKFNFNGTFQWCTYYGDSLRDLGNSCAVDVSGDVYLAGTTASTINIASLGHQTTHSGGTIDKTDGFLVKFNSAGARQWATYYGGTGDEDGNSVVTDASSNVYFGGNTTSTANISFGGYKDTNLGPNYDAFLVKFNSSGIRQMATYCGEINREFGFGIARDLVGNLYVAGYTESTNMGFNGHQNVYGGGGDSYLLRFCENLPIPGSVSGSTLNCSGSSQTYSVPLDPAALFYTWTLPSGWTGTSTTNIISVTTGVTGTVYVTASNTCAASPIQSISVIVNPLPIITVNSGSICIGNTFTINPNGASTYTFSGGSSIVSPTVSTSYSVTGTSTAGCVSASAAISNVTVNPIPVISVNSGSICAGNSFTMIPSGASTYTYSSGSSIVSPTIPSSYSVSGTSLAGCTSSVDAISNVTVNPLPTVVATSGTICAGQLFSLNASGASTYTWTPGNVIASSFTVNPTASAIYSVSGTSTAGCVGTSTANINVNYCSSTFSISINTPSVVCDATVSLFTANVGTTSISGSTWSCFPSGPSIYTPNSSSQNINFPTIKSLPVVPVAQSRTNTSSSATTFSVLNTPTLTSNSPAWTICPPGTAQGMLFCNASGAATYTWMPGFVVAPQLTLFPYPSVTTTYSVTGTATNGCTSSTTAVVNVHPQIPIYLSGPTAVCDGVNNCYSISMGFGGNMYFGMNGPCGFGDPTFAPCFSLALGCGGTFTAVCNGSESPYSCIHYTYFNINVATCTEVGQLELNSLSFEISPNPINDKLNLKTNSFETENIQLELTDITGKIISKSNCNFNSDGIYTIDVSELSSGIYFARIISGEQITKPIKIVKE